MLSGAMRELPPWRSGLDLSAGSALVPAGAHSRSRADRTWGPLLAAGTAALALSVYAATVAPGLTQKHLGADGGDLIAAARTLGVPHPTGYPTFTLLAWLFGQIPVGSAAMRTNLMSSVFAAGSVGLLVLAIQQQRWLRPHTLPLSAAAGLTLAFSPLFWSQAVITEVYSLLSFLAALLVWLLALWLRGGSNRILGLAAFIFGLGLGNHLTLGFLLPPTMLVLWPERGRWLRPRVLLPTAALLIVGLSVYAYLPLAAHGRPPVNWGDPRTWARFVWVVTARQYQPFAFGLAPQAMAGRLGLWSAGLGRQFGWWGLGLALAGGWLGWHENRQATMFGVLWAAPIAAYAFFYNVGDAHVYLLPLASPMALCWGRGAAYLLDLAQHLHRTAQRLILVALVSLPLVSLLLHWQEIDLSDDREAEVRTAEVLAAIAPDSIVVTRQDGPTFSLWYALYAERQRPDVTPVNGPLLAYAWYRENLRRQYPHIEIPEPTSSTQTTDDLVRELVTHNLALRSVYATDPHPSWTQWLDFQPVGASHVYRVGLAAKWEPPR